MKILRQKLLYKFLIFIIPFIVLSIMITGAVLSLTNYAFFDKTINQDYRNIIRSSAGEIQLFMENAQKNLDSLALMMSATKFDAWQKGICLTAFLNTNTQFMSVDLLSPEGKKIASTIENENKPVSIRDTVFQTAVNGKKAISNVIFTKDNLPVVNIAVPVFHLGKVHEVLWAVLNLKSVWDILEGITIGKTGQVYIMDVSGRYIAHREIDKVVRSSPSQSPQILARLRKSDSPVEWIKDNNGVRDYNIGLYVPGLDWIIVLNQKTREIYAYLYDNIYWAVLITCIIFLIAVYLGFKWIRMVLSPIQSLHQEVRIIGKGDLDHRVSVKTHDEIGELANSFNEMTRSLKKYIYREVENAKALTHAKNLALLGTASSKVTHEVKNFLSNIDFALAGLRNEHLNPKSKTILEIMENESGQVKEFIENFLQFAKKPELRLQKMPLDLIIKELLSIIQPEAQKRGIHIEFAWMAEIPTVNIDAGLMRNVFTNLIKNSMDAITGTGEIRIAGEMKPGALAISINDTGQGIDKDTMNHMFEPFFTTKKKQGTGLGLPIVKSIIESHGGTIQCQSTPGEGTTFVILLPLH